MLKRWLLTVLNSHFAVDLARKDAGHALALAASAGAKLKDVEVADAHLAVVQKRMGPRAILLAYMAR
jgi:3-hydroxyisobutyrate dehydrogenase-like beta-hydroxyacid dehydrogenase